MGGESNSFHLYWAVPTKTRLKKTEPTVLSALALTRANPQPFAGETNSNLTTEQVYVICTFDVRAIMALLYSEIVNLLASCECRTKTNLLD